MTAITDGPLDVRVEWDDEAGVWIATSEDVPGLCCEAAEFEKLISVVVALVPELLVANGVVAVAEATEVQVRLSAERHAVARLVA